MAPSFYGFFSILGGLLSGSGFLETKSGHFGRGLFHFPKMLMWTEIVEGLIWIGLGTAVWRKFPSMVRRSIALLVLMKGTRNVVWLIFPSTLTNPWWLNIILGLIWLGLGSGIWRASEWARRGCMILGLAFYGYQVAITAWAMRQVGGWMSSHPVFHAQATILAVTAVALPPLALAIYGVLRSTRDHFAETRGARASAMTRS